MFLNNLIYVWLWLQERFSRRVLYCYFIFEKMYIQRFGWVFKLCLWIFCRPCINLGGSIEKSRRPIIGIQAEQIGHPSRTNRVSKSPEIYEWKNFKEIVARRKMIGLVLLLTFFEDQQNSGAPWTMVNQMFFYMPFSHVYIVDRQWKCMKILG